MNQPPTREPALPARSFSDIFSALDEGVPEQEATEALPQLVAAVSRTGKPGKLVIEVAVRPNGQGQVALVARTKVTTPGAVTNPTSFYCDRDGNLGKSPPTQLEFETTRAPLTSIPGGATSDGGSSAGEPRPRAASKSSVRAPSAGSATVRTLPTTSQRARVPGAGAAGETQEAESAAPVATPRARAAAAANAAPAPAEEAQET